MKMTSSKPYLIRALYEWIVDNSLTPYMVVDAQSEGVMVPQQHVNKDGQIVLNVAPQAVVDLKLDGDSVRFNARFGGISTDIFVPGHAVLGIYARENGQGMMFDPEAPPTPPKPTKPSPAASGKNKPAVKPAEGRPSLRVVK